MAQLLVQGTNFLNFMGKYIYVANGGDRLCRRAGRGEHGAAGGAGQRPAADGVSRSTTRSSSRRTEFKTSSDEHGGGEVLDVQLRGEYLYAAMGAGGFRVFDVANVDVKDVSERLISCAGLAAGPAVLCQDAFATAVASPSTLALDPLRTADRGERRAGDRAAVCVPLCHRQV
jgi:hypothetical protein